MLCASPLAKGLFQGAIAESGASFAPVLVGGGLGDTISPLPAAEKAGAAWARTLGVSRIAELRKLPADKIQAASQRQLGVAGPNVDGWVIADDQYKLYKAGRYSDVPVVIGYNSDEGATFDGFTSQEAYVQSLRKRYGPFADRILAAYPGGETPAGKRTARNLARDAAFGSHAWTWARLQTETGNSKVFLYYFNEHPDYPTDSPKAGFGTPHSEELPYVFRQLNEHDRPAPTPKDEAMSDMMRTYWTNFAKTGDPNGAGLPNWPAYSAATPETLHIESGNTQAGPIVDEAGLKVLDEYYAWRRSGEDQPPASALAPESEVHKKHID
jgi:para-nitrobenzyl esterase